jgi:23S rRNA pseudouridine2605 synthase
MLLMMRVQRILAMAGVASRRKCEELIRAGRVKVNGALVEIGATANPVKDKIFVDDKPVILEKKVYILLNKPRGFVTTVSEQYGMKTVRDIVKVKERVFPVGRLDKETRGLLLLTNDGDFANKLTHPSFEIKKEYVATLDKTFAKDSFEKLRKGVKVEGRKVDVKEITVNGKKVTLKIHEGRKHIVRKLFFHLGYRVVDLQRTRVGNLGISGLKEGEWRNLALNELTLLKKPSSL